jgi:hypothetical protein
MQRSLRGWKISLLQSKHPTRIFSTNPFKIPSFIKFDEIKISFTHLGVLPPHFVIGMLSFDLAWYKRHVCHNPNTLCIEYTERLFISLKQVGRGRS